MKTYPISELPLTELTAEDIDELVFHSTPGAMRRAIAVNENFTEPESENVPQITYYKEGEETFSNKDEQEVTEAVYSAHVLDTDVLKFLLKQSIA